MLVPDSVLAAIIAGTATLSASFLQLRSALLREGSGRSASAARRRNRIHLIIFLIIVGAAAASGFALSQWLTAGERAAQSVLERELQARVAELSRTASALEATRGSERADIESGVLRRLGTDGVTVTATVAACRPALIVSPPGASSPPGAATEAAPPVPRTCTEAEASPVTLCATIPAQASITEVALFSRLADSDAPWSANRLLPGQESGQARFTEKYAESAPAEGVRQVCQGFTQWSAEHARVVRMTVRYSLPS
jgi:hypothetical protein